MVWIALLSLVFGTLLVNLCAMSVTIVVMLLALKVALVVILTLVAILLWLIFRHLIERNNA